MRKRNKCITSLDYIPGPKDLGMSDDEHCKLSMENPTKMMNIIEHWIFDNNRKIAERKKDESRLAALEAVSHWYNTERHDDIVQAIEKTRVMADRILGHYIKQQKNEKLFIYFSDLQYRVKIGMFTLSPAEPKKLKKFPKYDPSRKEIFGSDTSIVKLWIHVFSLKR